MSGSIKSKENFWLLSFWRLMSRVNNVQENIISGEIKPRRIKSQGNSCPGGKFWRKTYREEKVWGKDGAKPLMDNIIPVLNMSSVRIISSHFTCFCQGCFKRHGTFSSCCRKD